MFTKMGFLARSRRAFSRSTQLGILIYTFLYLTASDAQVNVEDSLTGPEHLLYKDLFASYNHESRPVKNASHSVTVNFALALNQLLDLDEKNQVLTTSVWIYEEWRDESLRWSPSRYEGQTALMIPASSIWLPDIFIFNTAGPNMNGFVNVNGSKVSIQHDGQVKWMVPLMVASACAVDVTYFPYDRQTCEIKFGSWIYDIDQLNILVDSDKPDMEHYVMNSEYDLENVSIHRGILDSSCCPGNGRHPMVKLSVHLRRKSLYYDYIVIAPTIMLCVMTLASFLLPCDRGEKMNIGLTVFLTLYVLQLRIADNVPDTNSTPILGVFMLVVMTFNCVSLIMATLVMNIKKLGDGSPCPDVPRWLFALCRHVLGRAVCTPYIWAGDVAFGRPQRSQPRSTKKKRGEERVEKKEKERLNNRTMLKEESFPNDVTSQAMNLTGAAITDRSMNNLEEIPHTPIKRPGKGNGIVASYSNDLHDATSSQYDHNDVATNGKGNSEKSLADKVGLRLRRPLGNPDDQQTKENAQFWPLYDQHLQTQNQEAIKKSDQSSGFIMKKRWFYVAEVVDKFLFVVYLVLLTGSIFTVLYLIPVHFRNDGY